MSDIILRVLIGLLILVALVMFVVIIHTIYIEIRNANLDYQSTSTTAIVSNLAYRRSYTTYIPIKVNKVTIQSPVFHAAQYNIHLSLPNGQTGIINNQAWFNHLKIGETVNVILHTGRDKNGNILNNYLTFAE